MSEEQKANELDKEAARLLAEIRRHVQQAAALLAALEPETGKPGGKRAKTYGSPERINYRVTVDLEALYPNFGGYDPVEVLRMKPSRVTIARAVGQAVAELMVGYKIGVRVENDHSGWAELELAE